MAIKDIFKGGSARTRLIIVIGAIAGFVAIAYVVSNYLGGPAAVNAAKVANAPASLQSVPGGQLTPEYYRALAQTNEQTAKQAQITGASSVSTLINVGQPVQSNCTIMCGDESADTTNDVNDLLKNGKISQAEANQLLDMAKNNVPVSEYEANLQRLVREGKITPEEARRLLAQYKKQHANAATAESAQLMDSLIKSGQLPVDAANSLLDLQKKNVSPEQYAAELNRLVKEGKISPELASQLLSQYSGLKAKQAAEESASDLQAMARSGQISKETADQLSKLQGQNVPVDQYKGALDRLVAEGKMTPATAAELLAKYKAQRAGLGPAATLSGMVGNAEKDAANDVDALVKSGKLSSEEGAALLQMQKSNVSPEDYAKYLDRLVKEGKLSPDEAKKLLGDYVKLHGLKQTAANLQTAQGNNVSPAQYEEELKKAVAAGILTPEQASALMQEYQSFLNPPLPLGAGPQAMPGTDADFAALQQRLAAQQAAGGTTTATGPDLAAQFAAAQAQAASDAARRHQEQIQTLLTSMSGQAQNIIPAWQESPVMQIKLGVPPTTGRGVPGAKGRTGTGSNASNQNPNSPGAVDKPPLIKSGTIYYAMLTTAVDSDYPDTPVMATVVDGPFKGAKVLGKLALAQGMDRLSLNFTSMDMQDWPKTKSINAYAMDPDTARTVMASNVNHHYLLRYGTLFASSFLTGYATSITNAGTATTGIFGTSTTHPSLSPGNKIAVGLGQVGTAFSAAIGSYINTPTTVKINSGVGIGLLFVSDVT